MLMRRAGLLDWDRHSIRWGLIALVFALFVGAMAQRSVGGSMQAADTDPSSLAEPA
jgi:hypothetical protein